VYRFLRQPVTIRRLSFANRCEPRGKFAALLPTFEGNCIAKGCRFLKGSVEFGWCFPLPTLAIRELPRSCHSLQISPGSFLTGVWRLPLQIHGAKKQHYG
jgi:hypothetical protein